MGIYEKAVQNLRTAIASFREKNLPIQGLQTEISNAAQAISTIEERELQEFLDNSESQLESVRFTVNQSEQFDHCLKIITQIEAELAKRY
jgi:hypothetical protein